MCVQKGMMANTWPVPARPKVKYWLLYRRSILTDEEHLAIDSAWTNSAFVSVIHVNAIVLGSSKEVTTCRSLLSDRTKYGQTKHATNIKKTQEESIVYGLFETAGLCTNSSIEADGGRRSTICLANPIGFSWKDSYAKNLTLCILFARRRSQ